MSNDDNPKQWIAAVCRQAREGPATESIEPRLSARNFRAICAMIRAKENPADQ